MQPAEERETHQHPLRPHRAAGPSQKALLGWCASPTCTTSKCMVPSAGNPPQLPLSSLTNEMSWQVLATEAGCSSQLCLRGASHQMRGFFQERGTRLRSHKDSQDPRSSCKTPALTSALCLPTCGLTLSSAHCQTQQRKVSAAVRPPTTHSNAGWHF